MCKWVCYSDQLDGLAGQTSSFYLKPWPVRIFEDFPLSLYIVAASESDKGLVLLLQILRLVLQLQLQPQPQACIDFFSSWSCSCLSRSLGLSYGLGLSLGLGLNLRLGLRLGLVLGLGLILTLFRGGQKRLRASSSLNFDKNNYHMRL